MGKVALQLGPSDPLDAGASNKGRQVMEAASMRKDRKGTHVGRVVGLWRYPVKSMAGESLSEAEVFWHGLVADRRWAFIRNGVERSGFPCLTPFRCRSSRRRRSPVLPDE